MMAFENFEIRLEERCLEDWFDPPEDPLGELSAFEMGLQKFCYEYNHKFTIKIGKEIIFIHFDPDLILILDELPKEIGKLAKNEKIEIYFTENWMSIKLVPVDRQKINVQLKKWGNSVEEENFKLDKNQALGVLRSFVEEVMQMAVDGGYVTAEEKQEFLMPMRESVEKEAIA